MVRQASMAGVHCGRPWRRRAEKQAANGSQGGVPFDKKYRGWPVFGPFSPSRVVSLSPSRRVCRAHWYTRNVHTPHDCRSGKSRAPLRQAKRRFGPSLAPLPFLLAFPTAGSPALGLF